MCDPITLALGIGLSTAGGLWGSNDALNNAKRQAAARNGVLSSTIGDLNQIYGNTNAPAFASAVGGIPTAASLKGAQDARAGAIAGNIPTPAGAGGPVAPAPSDAPPALNAEKAANMKNAFDAVKNQATATGNLGGYGDSWFNSGLTEQDAARRIGVGNTFANEDKSLLGPEQDLAQAAAYKTPSPWPGLLQGVGSLLGSASGKGGGIGSIFASLAPKAPAQAQYFPAGGGDSFDWG